MDEDRFVISCDKWTKEFEDQHEAYMYMTSGDRLNLPDYSRMDQLERGTFEEEYRDFLDELAVALDAEEFCDILNQYDKFLYERDFRPAEEC